jgi:large subunit ribosomal protein L18
MHNEIQKCQKKRQSRRLRVRRNLRGCPERPRLCVVKSNKHIELQVIDDEQGATLVGLGTRSKEFKGTEFAKKSRAAAERLGIRLAEILKEKGVEAVKFDRGFSSYRGVLGALADAMRENGIAL